MRQAAMMSSIHQVSGSNQPVGHVELFLLEEQQGDGQLTADVQLLEEERH